MARRYFVADTETTGTDDSAGVVEVGFIEINQDLKIIDQVESLIDPQCPISPSASGIHGIVYEDVENSPTLGEFFSADAAGCYGKKLKGEIVLIGHRISFDSKFLRPHIDGSMLEVCTLRWARRMYPDADDHKLQTLKYALGLPRNRSESHRVMADIMDAYHLMVHILNITGLTLDQLVEESQKPMMIRRCPMGKHKGEEMSKVPRSYLSWMNTNMDMDPDLKFTVETLLYGKKENNNGT